MSRLIAEDAPDVVVGPVCDMSTQDGQAKFWRWMLEMHVTCCSKGGVDCRTCEEAGRQGITRPA